MERFRTRVDDLVARSYLIHDERGHGVLGREKRSDQLAEEPSVEAEPRREIRRVRVHHATGLVLSQCGQHDQQVGRRNNERFFIYLKEFLS